MRQTEHLGFCGAFLARHDIEGVLNVLHLLCKQVNPLLAEVCGLSLGGKGQALGWAVLAVDHLSELLFHLVLVALRLLTHAGDELLTAVYGRHLLLQEIIQHLFLADLRLEVAYI